MTPVLFPDCQKDQNFSAIDEQVELWRFVKTITGRNSKYVDGDMSFSVEVMSFQ